MNKNLQVVTFEQAKKLKELEFDWGKEYDYLVVELISDENSGINWHKGKIGEQFKVKDRKTEINNYEVLEINNYEGCGIDKNNCKVLNKYSAPTTSLAIKWLRDKKDIHNPPEKVTGGYRIWIKGLNADGYTNFNSYEEAESAGLDYALEYLNPKNKES